MKAEKLFDAITGIREEIVEEAARHRFRKRRKLWLGAAAAVLVLSLCLGMFQPATPLSAHAISEAVYPEVTAFPTDGDYFAYQQWKREQEARLSHEPYSDGLTQFLMGSAGTILSETGQTNPVFSPVSVYLSLAMTAELTGGNSRRQILDVLGEDSIPALRKQANTLWNANYSNDGRFTSILASALWLNDKIGYNSDTMKILAKNYYASAFQGTMGEPDYTQRLTNWLSEQTGGHLQEQAAAVELDRDAAMALVTTVYFHGEWSLPFATEDITSGIFHTPEGDVDAEFMHRSESDDYYWAGQFGAVALPIQEGAATMWLLLPDEGVSPEALLEDPQTMEFILSGGDWADQKNILVNLAVPKFDVSCSIDLCAPLKRLGITDVFSRWRADFSAMSETDGDAFISQLPHCVRVSVNEVGCTAAAYTVEQIITLGIPPEDEVDFILDRPFLFAITSADQVPLFIGIVNKP